MAYRLGVDVGGTFTDLFLVDDDRARQWRVKTPSTPRDPSDGVLTGVERICAQAGIAPGDLRNLVHGTTVATNAMLEGRAPASGSSRPRASARSSISPARRRRARSPAGSS
jgi:N-methylhydantoinase A